MNNKNKRPYSTPSRTIKSKGMKKNNATDRVMKTAAASKNRKNTIPSRTEKSINKENEKKNVSNNVKNKTPKTKKVDLEQTTIIRIDKDRINDFETLDTSFLEGRLDKKLKNNKNKKEKLLKEKKPSNINFDIVRKIISFLIAIVIIALLCVVFYNVMESYNEKRSRDAEVKTQKKDKEETKVIEEKQTKSKDKKDSEIDDNYLFIGDFHTERFNFDDYDYHYVKVSEKELTTRKTLDDLKGKIYKYNPSIIFIQLGIIDLDEDKSVDEIIDNLREIVEKVNENRPYSEIYVESLYPINKDVDDYNDKIISKDIDNKKIIEVNDKIKELVKEKKINYLDLFSVLSEDDKLKDNYTDNGVELNDNGYKEIRKEIDKIVG